MHRIGFSTILIIGKDITISDSPSNAMPTIISTTHDGRMIRQMSAPKVVGIMLDNNKNPKLIIEKAAALGRPIFISTSEITSQQNRFIRVKKLKIARKIVSLARHYGARIAMASLAGSSEAMISSGQAIELGKFLGLEQHDAKLAISAIGERQ